MGKKVRIILQSTVIPVFFLLTVLIIGSFAKCAFFSLRIE